MDVLNSFLHRIALLLLTMLSLLVSVFGGNPAVAGSIHVSLPLSGDFAELGQEFRKGAELAMQLHGTGHVVRFIDDGCDEDFGTMASEDLAQAEPDIVLGYLCNAPAIKAATALSENQTPIIVANARSVRLIKDRDREQWNLWRMAPGDDYPVIVAAQTITRLWKNVPFAIVDDGTIYGRNFTDQLRLELDEAGLKPQFSDTFRAAQSTQAGLLRRLKRSGVTAAFMASATLEDLLTIALNITSLGIELEVMTSEALVALPLLESSTQAKSDLLVIAAPPPQEKAMEALLKEKDIHSTRLVYEGFSAMQIALQALADTQSETTEKLSNDTFQTVLGPIRFHGDGSSSYNPYRALKWNGTSLKDIDIGDQVE